VPRLEATTVVDVVLTAGRALRDLASGHGSAYGSFMSEIELVNAALALPRATRADLVARLLDSLNEAHDELSQAEWDRAMLEEAGRRLDAVERGDISMVPAADALAEVRGHLTRGR